ncbi:MAG: hypothetical protein K2W94_07800 [Alphaproteobacteria bacterium]|nr:hypothetical protein [Alphaproteobacteria bacterium]
MKNNFFIGIYWGKRKEELTTCTAKIKSTLDLLSSLDNSFTLWYKTSKPRKGEVLQPVDTSSEGIKTLLLKGQNYNDVGELLEDLGYLIVLKSEKDFSKAHILSVICGCYFEKTPNSITLNIGKNNAHKDLAKREVLENLYRGLIEIWKPDKGILRCNSDEILSDTF